MEQRERAQDIVVGSQVEEWQPPRADDPEHAVLVEHDSLGPPRRARRVQYPGWLLHPQVVRRRDGRACAGELVERLRVRGPGVVGYDHCGGPFLPVQRSTDGLSLSIGGDDGAGRNILEEELYVFASYLRAQAYADRPCPRHRQVALDEGDAVAHEEHDGVAVPHALILEMAGQVSGSHPQIRVGDLSRRVSERDAVTMRVGRTAQELRHGADDVGSDHGKTPRTDESSRISPPRSL